MDRATAERINTLMYKINSEIDDFIIMVLDHGTPEEISRFRLTAGKFMGYIYFDILKPIHDEYPDLMPEALR